MEDFPSNRHKDHAKTDLRAPTPKTEPVAAPEEKKTESVVTNKVVVRQPSLLAKAKKTFLAANADSVKEYIFYEVVVPAIKGAISEATSGGIDRLLYGSGTSTSNKPLMRSNSLGTKTNYSGISSSKSLAPGRYSTDAVVPNRSSRELGEILLATRQEAEHVVRRLAELLDRYQTVSVADLFDLLNLSSQFTDDKWGWTSLEQTEIRRVRAGHQLILPDPQPLK